MQNAAPRLGVSDPERKDVWLPDAAHGYVPAFVVREHDGQSECCLENGSMATVPTGELSEMNPRKFDKVADMGDLTYLNEASVVHNLRQRYFSDLIYVRRSTDARRTPGCSSSP